VIISSKFTFLVRKYFQKLQIKNVGWKEKRREEEREG